MQNLKDQIENKLKAAGAECRFIPLPEDLPIDIASHVAFHKITLAQAMATILYKTETGFIAAVKRADTQIDEEKLKTLAAVTTLAYASKEDLAQLGAESGIVPFLGLDIPYLVDTKVLEVGKIYGTGGTKTLGMSMLSQDLLKVNHGAVGDFTVFDRASEMVERGGHRILSGITPSGDGSLHIGNYLGAVKQFIDLAHKHECFLMVADLHALTTIQDKKQLQHNVETLVLNELALLGDLENITFFRQSDVPLHTELQSILNNVTPLGLLKRSHAYKDKLARDVMEDEINLGLFNYPILMAADILIYKPDLVPVGKDQKQHVEIARDIGEKFNKVFKKKVFPLPEFYVPPEVAMLLGTDGKRKMSKSLGNLISIFESEDVIRKQVNSTFTDPTRAHATDPGHIEGNMVFTYLEHFPSSAPNFAKASLGEKATAGKGSLEELKERYKQGKVADVEVKEYLFACLMSKFAPARARYQELKESPQKVKEILETGAAKASSVASKTMTEVREVVGLTNGYSFFKYSHPERSEGSLANARSSDQLRDSSPAKRDQNDKITIDQFAAVELRVGKVIEARNKEGSDKLIRLVVDIGVIGEMRPSFAKATAGEKGLEHEVRIIFTGVRPFGYTPEDFLDKQFLFITNLVPRKMLDEVSQGMILAVDGINKKPVFVSAEGMPIGAKIR